jgi:preprotein translocase subunit SecY
MPPALFLASTVITLTGGTILLMWLGEQITARGVGQGISLIIFAGIVAHYPGALANLLEQGRQGALSSFVIVFFFVIIVATILFIVYMERAQRRILIQYPKRQVSGNRMVGGEASHLPLKLNTAGVIPPIFASSLLLLPLTFLQFQPETAPDWLKFIATHLQHGMPVYMALYGALIIFFCFFYTAIVFNPADTADNLKKYGGFIPGIRPGKQTAEYIDKVLTRLTVVGAAYLTAVCLIPEFVMGTTHAFHFGGTSLLIIVSVTMDTVAQIQSHLLAHQYEGLIKKAKLKGARR